MTEERLRYIEACLESNLWRRRYKSLRNAMITMFVVYSIIVLALLVLLVERT